jgi:hypothetical protein
MAQLKTAREWAELYQTAIEALVSGTVSSYSISGRSVTKHNLAEIERLHRYWLGRAQSESGGFVTYANMTAASSEGADDA